MLGWKSRVQQVLSGDKELICWSLVTGKGHGGQVGCTWSERVPEQTGVECRERLQIWSGLCSQGRLRSYLPARDPLIYLLWKGTVSPQLHKVSLKPPSPFFFFTCLIGTVLRFEYSMKQVIQFFTVFKLHGKDPIRCC